MIEEKRERTAERPRGKRRRYEWLKELPPEAPPLPFEYELIRTKYGMDMLIDLLEDFKGQKVTFGSNVLRDHRLAYVRRAGETNPRALAQTLDCSEDHARRLQREARRENAANDAAPRREGI
jgi:hypothetical protein